MPPLPPAAADRLRADGELVVADRIHLAGVDDETHVATVTARATESADADVDRVRISRRPRESDSATHVEATVTT